MYRSLIWWVFLFQYLKMLLCCQHCVISKAVIFVLVLYMKYVLFPLWWLHDFSLIFHFQQLDWSVCDICLFIVYLAWCSPNLWDMWFHEFHYFEIIPEHCLSGYFSHPISSLLMQHQSFVLYYPQAPGPCSFFSTLFFFFVLDHWYWLIFKPTGAFLSCVKSSDVPIKGILCFLYCGFS